MKLLRHLPPALLLTGLVYRAAGVLASAIWYDEAVSLYRTTLPFWTLGGMLLRALKRKRPAGA